MQIFAETDYRSDLTANHSIELILGSFPHLYWHKEGDGLRAGLPLLVVAGT